LTARAVKHFFWHLKQLRESVSTRLATRGALIDSGFAVDEGLGIGATSREPAALALGLGEALVERIEKIHVSFCRWL
jgi:hypothetical protein